MSNSANPSFSAMKTPCFTRGASQWTFFKTTQHLFLKQKGLSTSSRKSWACLKKMPIRFVIQFIFLLQSSWRLRSCIFQQDLLPTTQIMFACLFQLVGQILDDSFMQKYHHIFYFLLFFGIDSDKVRRCRIIKYNYSF